MPGCVRGGCREASPYSIEVAQGARHAAARETDRIPAGIPDLKGQNLCRRYNPGRPTRIGRPALPPGLPAHPVLLLVQRR